MRFHYRLSRTKYAVLSLGGRWVRPKPIIGVTVIGPADGRIVQGHLDTASDDTVFPEAMAAKLGIDLTNAPVGEASGVGMASVPLRFAEVTLRIANGGERREWPAWVGFTSVPIRRPLLGFAGCLQFFSATFLGDREEVDLTVNSL